MGPRSVDLVLSMDLATLADLAVQGVVGPVHAGRWGTATTDLIRRWAVEWLGPDTRIVFRPVLDLTDPARITAVDGHDPPEQMAWYVRLRDPVCVFPGCTRPSSRCDLDHIEAYLPLEEGGPPGQTHPDNLAPLCRGIIERKRMGVEYSACPTADTGGGVRPDAPSTPHHHAADPRASRQQLNCVRTS